MALAFLVAGVAALVTWFPWREDALDRVRREGVLRVGYAVEAPYAFLTPDGKVTGEAPEIARVVADRLGIPRLEFRLVEFGALIDALEAGRVDVVAAGMFVTPGRERRVAFSRPTFEVRPALLVRRGNPLGLHSYADLAGNALARGAVVTGAVEEKCLLEVGVPPERLVRVPDALSGAGAVAAGTANGLALSAPAVRWLAMNAEGALEVAEPFTPPAIGLGVGRGAFAFRKDDRALRRAWDRELEAFVGTAAHRRLVEGFGFTPGELPGGPAAGAAGRP